MSYVELDFVKRVLRDDYLIYPESIDDYDDFAKAEINARLAGTYLVPFDDALLYPAVPPLIKWIAAYLVGYKLFDERTSMEELGEATKGTEWWNMAQLWLNGLAGGTYVLSDIDGSAVVAIGSITAPRFYPSGLKLKAPNADNVPYFTRDQAGKW